MKSFRSWLKKHKTFALSIGFLVAFSVSVSYATPPTSPYSAGETLDPTCAPGTANCTVTAGTPSPWTVTGNDVYYTAGDAFIHGLQIGLGGGSITTNTAFGTSALSGNTTGSLNTAVGYQALSVNGAGVQNTAVGYQALMNSTGSYNTAIGRWTLVNNTTGQQNTALGLNAMRFNTTGFQNIGLGVNALSANIGGSQNTAVGNSALAGNISGQRNTAIGLSALFSNTAGSYNIGIGINTLFSTTGSYNIALGAAVDVPVTSGSGQLNIGNVLYGTGLYQNGITVSSTPTVAGRIGIGTTTPQSTLDVNGEIQGKNLNITGTSGTSIAPPSGLNLNIIEDPSYQYVDMALDSGYYVFSYKIINGAKVFSASSSSVFGGNNDMDPYAVQVSWNAVPGADGYRILTSRSGYYTYGDYAYDTTDTSFIDGDGSMSYSTDPASTAVTPNSIYTNTNNINGAVAVTGNITTAAGITARSASFSDAIIATGTIDSGAVVPDLGEGTRMMWIPSVAAFRAGGTTGPEWDSANVGQYSTAFGFGTKASAFATTAFGDQSKATADYATAFGFFTTASGQYSTALGYLSTASATSSVAFGDQSQALGESSTAFGSQSIASGFASTTFGLATEASGDYSTAFGSYAVASNNYATAFGNQTTASGQYSTAFGNNSVASGENSTVFGLSAQATGARSVAFGTSVLASEADAVAFGNSTTASGQYSTAFGISTIALGTRSTAFGTQTTASGSGSTSFGTQTTASGSGSTSFGTQTTASGLSSTSFGNTSIASGDYSTAFGNNTVAGSSYSTAFGSGNIGGGNAVDWIATDPLFEIGNQDPTVSSSPSNALTVLKNGYLGLNTATPRAALDIAGDGAIIATGTLTSGINVPDLGAGVKMMWIPSKAAFRAGQTNSTEWNNANVGSHSTAFGRYTKASGFASIASGNFSVATGNSSSAFGLSTFAAGDGSTAFGDSSRAIGNSSTAFGNNTQALGNNSTAFGGTSIAAGDYSTAFGNTTLADSYNSAAFGAFNVGGGDPSNWVDTDSLFEIGNGYFDQINSVEVRTNALTVLKNGNVGIKTATPGTLLSVGDGTVAAGNVAHFQTATGTCDLDPSNVGGLSCSSDMNLKKNITVLADNSPWSFTANITTANNSIFAKLVALTPVQYNFKAEADNDVKHTGFIAQEVEQLFPDLVETSKDGKKTMNYVGLVPYAIQVIQDMNFNITKLDDVSRPNTWRESLVAWLGNANNGIRSLVVHDRVCINETCVTEAQLKQLLNQQNNGGGGSTTVTNPPAQQEEIKDTPPADEKGDAPEGKEDETIDTGDKKEEVVVPVEPVTPPADVVVPAEPAAE